MIGNLTGDIGLYLRNGETGWVVPDASVEALVATLKQVVRVSPGYQSAMRASAKAEAGRSFDLRNYVDLLREFIGPETTAVNKVIGQHGHG
jgi:glycosyltransferase involved in cell wall biosynthesis